jgi:uncharacterized integral membrane protein
MFRVILSIVLLVILVVLIVLNLGFTTSFNLFGWKFEDIPVTAVALVAFAVGVLYSFAYYLGRYFSKISKSRFKMKGERVKAREQELKQKERDLIEQQAGDSEEVQDRLQTSAGQSDESSSTTSFGNKKSSRKKRGK